MMHPPRSVTADLFSSLDMQAITAELIDRAGTEPDGKAARTLFKSPELTIVAMGMRAGAELLEHAAPGPVLVVPVTGRVSFSSEGSPDAEVSGKKHLAMGPGLRHAVVATENAAFLLVIGGRPRE